MKRLLDLDIAIGISIVLVVFGHLKFKENTILWYIPVRNLLYQFHMPLFMFFSGFLISYTYKPIKSFKDYKSFVLRKNEKFIPPYVAFSLFFIAFEFISSNYDIQQLQLDLTDMILYPSKAPAGFLWYIYVLFQFYLCLPLLKFLVSKSIFLSLIVAILFQFQTSIEIFNLNLFSFYFLFIILGIIATHKISNYYTILNKYGCFFILIFIIFILANYYYEMPKVLMGVISIPAIHFVGIKLLKSRAKKLLIKIGRHSFYIYLMNTLIIGLLYLIFVKRFDFIFSYFLFILFFISGLSLPIIIYKKIINKITFLNKVIQ